jgi:hypothetical protein
MKKISIKYCLHSNISFCFYFLMGLGFELQAKQVLYYLSHTSSLFCSGYYGGGGFMNYLT